jgi:hypothetical protein
MNQCTGVSVEAYCSGTRAVGPVTACPMTVPWAGLETSQCTGVSVVAYCSGTRAVELVTACPKTVPWAELEMNQCRVARAAAFRRAKRQWAAAERA